MDELLEISKELRHRITVSKRDSQYEVGRAEGLREALQITDAVLLTKKCPSCGGRLDAYFCESIKEIVMKCNTYNCKYELPLNQFGF